MGKYDCVPLLQLGLNASVEQIKLMEGIFIGSIPCSALHAQKSRCSVSGRI